MASEMTPPSGWGDDELTKFLDTTHLHQFAIFTNKALETKGIIEIDETFLSVIQKGLRPEYVHGPFMLLVRAHSAYRAAASCAFSGQAAELYPLLRLMLEQGGYAFLMMRNPTLQDVWMDRETNRSKVKQEFTIAKIKSLVASWDEHLETAFRELYEEAIDLGAHPNEMSVTASIIMEEHEGLETFKILYTHPDGPVLNHLLRSLTRVGICVLLLFHKVFPMLFELSDTSTKLTNYRRILLGPED